MFDLGWTELLLIGIVALIVVGPEDLPGLFRSVGRFMGKARGMAREFTNAMNAAADESGVRDIDKTIRAAANPARAAGDALKSATKSTFAPGTATDRLSKERREAAEKIHENAAKTARERQAREAAETAAAKTPTPDTLAEPEVEKDDT